MAPVAPAEPERSMAEGLLCLVDRPRNRVAEARTRRGAVSRRAAVGDDELDAAARQVRQPREELRHAEEVLLPGDRLVGSHVERHTLDGGSAGRADRLEPDDMVSAHDTASRDAGAARFNGQAEAELGQAERRRLVAEARLAELALLTDAVVGHLAGGAPADADETALRIPPHFLQVGHRLRLPRSQIDKPVLQLGPARRGPRSRVLAARMLH